MAFAYLSFGGRALAIAFPDAAAAAIRPFLPTGPDADTQPIVDFALRAAGDEAWQVWSADELLWGPGLLGDALNSLFIAAHGRLAAELPASTAALHAAGLVVKAGGLLMPGVSRGGKSTLVSRLLGLGFGYLTDDVSFVAADGTLTAPFRPLTVRADTWGEMQSRGNTWTSLPLADGRRLVAVEPAAATAAPVGIILLPRFEAGATLSLELLSPARAAMRLMQHNHSGHDEASYGLDTLAGLAARVPTLALTYGKSEQIGGPLGNLIERIVAGLPREEIVRRLPQVVAEVARLSRLLDTTARPLPAPTARKGPVRLTIGMATYDDYDGVYFTIQALRLYHPDVLDDAEFVVVDNHPDGAAAPFLKGLENAVGNYRYVPFLDRGGTAAPRDRIVEEADGRYVLSLDCHVLLAPGAISRLLGYFAEHPDTPDLLQGPLLYDDGKSLSPYWKPTWGAGMYGQWASDARAADIDAPPFEIEMQGLGLYAFRKSAWPGFNAGFRGFGGEEFYIHEKFRHRGARTLCLPFLRWMHRFGRPGGIPYANKWEDRVRNYLIGHAEFGIATNDMEAHYRQLLGAEVTERLFRTARRDLGLPEPAAAATI